MPPHIAIAGKTGATNDNADVWFMGMTPSLVAGVWLGFDKPKTIMPGAFGGSLAAPIWANMIAIARYYGQSGAGEWPVPADLSIAELDRESGALADSTTPPTTTLLRVLPAWKGAAAVARESVEDPRLGSVHRSITSDASPSFASAVIGSHALMRATQSEGGAPRSSIRWKTA